MEKGVNADDSFWSIEASGKGKNILITLAKKEMGYGSWNDLLDSEKVDPVVTDRAFLEVKIGDEVVGKLSIGLFGTVCPQTVKNFVALCNGDNRGRLGSPLDFRGSPFHRCERYMYCT